MAGTCWRTSKAPSGLQGEWRRIYSVSALLFDNANHVVWLQLRSDKGPLAYSLDRALMVTAADSYLHVYLICSAAGNRHGDGSETRCIDTCARCGEFSLLRVPSRFRMHTCRKAVVAVHHVHQGTTA